MEPDTIDMMTENELRLELREVIMENFRLKEQLSEVKIAVARLEGWMIALKI